MVVFLDRPTSNWLSRLLFGDLPDAPLSWFEERAAKAGLTSRSIAVSAR